ncbi:MAG: phosphoglucosamine mutase [Saprospirales bacterium]|nr:MAG: phosphoglucosamine mutase [Saprospirales bacterium]
MTLITSVSGIRGTIGGAQGHNLTPPDVVKFISAYSKILLEKKSNHRPVVVIGRDGRISGAALSHLVSSTLSFCGIDVINCGLSTTPSVEMAVIRKKANGGIICTASHNPKHWNALKFLDNKGEFISAEMGRRIVEIAEKGVFSYAHIENLGSMQEYTSSIEDHIEDVLSMKMVSKELVASRKFKLCIDAINSTGAIAVPMLLDKMGVEYHLLFGDNFGNFAHEAEPLPKNLSALSRSVVEHSADLGVAVDPDVDRLVLLAEDGSHFGEEYTLVAIADYYLSHFGTGDTVSNLSSSAALTEVTNKYGGEHFQSAVGERHVVDLMKKKNALIGGEGNGGIICPELHYGRDAIAGIALFLTHLAKSGKKVSELRASYPNYFMSKEKVDIKSNDMANTLLDELKNHFSEHQSDQTDGLKVYFENSWAHIRPSNTEPILRIYTEAKNFESAQVLADLIKNLILQLQSK